MPRRSRTETLNELYRIYFLADNLSAFDLVERVVYKYFEERVGDDYQPSIADEAWLRRRLAELA